MSEVLDVWPWRARDRAKKQKPTTVKAVTYLGALVAAARHFGFVRTRYDGDEEIDTSKVEVRVIREYEIAKAESEAA